MKRKRRRSSGGASVTTRGAVKRQRRATVAKATIEYVLPLHDIWTLLRPRLDTLDCAILRMTAKGFGSLLPRSGNNISRGYSCLRVILGKDLLTVECARKGYTGLLKWALKAFPLRDRVSPDCVFTAAVEGGHLAMIEELGLDEDGRHISDLAYCRAVRGGHIHMLEWLDMQWCEEVPHLYPSVLCNEAAEKGHLEPLQWLRNLNPPCPWSAYTCAAAAYGGHLSILKWLRAQEPPCQWDSFTCKRAASGGHLHVLKWALAQDPPCPWHINLCEEAAAGGYLDVLVWAVAEGNEYNSVGMCWKAASGGHLHVLKWLRSPAISCPWDERTPFHAAWHGHLELFVWALENGCPWNARECLAIAKQNHQQHILEWIETCIGDDDDGDGEYIPDDEW